MRNRTPQVRFATNDRAITLRITFLEFEMISSCLFGFKNNFEGIKRRGAVLDEDQETLITILEEIARELYEQAKNSSSYLGIDRINQELDYADKVIRPFFAETAKRFELQKTSMLSDQTQHNKESKRI